MKEQSTRDLQPLPEDSPALANQLRHEAALALEDYLVGLRWGGRTTKGADHRDLERVRLQYLRLLEAAEWADDLAEKHRAGCEAPEGGDHGN